MAPIYLFSQIHSGLLVSHRRLSSLYAVSSFSLHQMILTGETQKREPELLISQTISFAGHTWAHLWVTAVFCKIVKNDWTSYTRCYNYSGLTHLDKNIRKWKLALPFWYVQQELCIHQVAQSIYSGRIRRWFWVKWWKPGPHGQLWGQEEESAKSAGEAVGQSEVLQQRTMEHHQGEPHSVKSWRDNKCSGWRCLLTFWRCHYITEYALIYSPWSCI